MSRAPLNAVVRLILVALCAAGTPAASRAQDTGLRDAPGLSLLDAVRVALRVKPDTLLQQQAVAASRGSALQTQGPFGPAP